MVQKVTYGNNIAKKVINEAGKYLVVTNPIPWDEWVLNVYNSPVKVVYCQDMEEKHLEDLVNQINLENLNFDTVIGFGGGVAIDTGKYLAWKLNKRLFTIPSIISVDAFLCEPIGIRNEDRVRYIGAVKADKILIDFELIRSAPPHLNYGGIGDSLSCATALGDWKIAHQEFGDPFDQGIFDETMKLVRQLFTSATEIRKLTDLGIQKIVDFLIWEVKLSEQWGNARPEEGGEHFLAYTLEKIVPARYLHGSLIALNTLVVLKMQGAQAIFSIDETQKFLDAVGVIYSPQKQGISRNAYKKALEYCHEYVISENLFHGIWSRKNPFTYVSVDQILDWVFNNFK